MVNLYVFGNQVLLRKDDPDFKQFVTSFLIKYEEVSKIDFYNSSKFHKVFRTVKERRDLYVELEDMISFSRGLLEVIPADSYRIVRQEEGRLVINVPTSEEIRGSLPDSFDLRDDQIVAVRKCLSAKRGVIQLPTAVGKSAIIASTIKFILKDNPDSKILVLAPTLSTVESINDTFLFNHITSHIYGHPSKEIRPGVNASLVQSLVTSKDSGLLKDIDAVFYDECLPYNSKILLPDFSYKEAGDIYNDDNVTSLISYNIELRKYEVKKILRKFKTPYGKKFWKVYYVDPVDYKLKGITLTPNHKVFTKNRGYVEAQFLNENDFIRVNFEYIQDLKDTFVRVVRVSKNVGKVSEFKYNFEVEDNHNYFANNVLVSNCHHLKCDTWNKLNLMVRNAEVSLGFSALSIDKSEIYKTDIRDLSYQTSLIVGSSGRVLMHMDPSYYISKGIIALPVIMRVDNRVQLSPEFDETNWSQLSKIGLMSSTRTEKISQIVSLFSAYKRKSLVLVSEKDYAFYLGRFLGRLNLKFGISFGAGKGYVFSYYSDFTDDCEYVNKDSLEVINMLSTGEIDILIGTSHVDEGVDIKSLDVCVLACGGKKDRRIIQRIGRVLRKSKTGKYAYVVDFTDNGSRVLSRQSRERLKMYKESIGVPSNLIFDGISVNEIFPKFKELEGLI